MTFTILELLIYYLKGDQVNQKRLRLMVGSVIHATRTAEFEDGPRIWNQPEARKRLHMACTKLIINDIIDIRKGRLVFSRVEESRTSQILHE